MARTLIVIAAFLTLSVSAALAVPPADKGKPESPGNSAAAPGQSLEQNAAKACKAERGTTDATIAVFKAKYGTNANKANAFGKCVSGKAKKVEAEDEASEQAEENAAKKCKALRKNDPAGFAALYGTRPNAYGKCVSATAKKLEAEADEDAAEAKENAAKKCKKERDTLGLVEFTKRYAPPNHPNGANAFGKCVSKLAKAQTSS